jgi:hypothetical protein
MTVRAALIFSEQHTGFSERGSLRTSRNRSTQKAEGD